jgi:hypothetical protein
MMRAQSRVWTVALICSALMFITAPRSIAQTSSQSTMQQEMTKQETLMSDGSQKVVDASKKMQEAMKILETGKDYAKARQLMTEADKTMKQGQELIASAEKIDATMLQELRRGEEAGREMMKGAKLMRNGMQMMMKDEQALSRATRLTREGHGMLERGQKVVMSRQL